MVKGKNKEWKNIKVGNKEETYKEGVSQCYDSYCHLSHEDDEDDAEELHGDKEPGM